MTDKSNINSKASDPNRSSTVSLISFIYWTAEILSALRGGSVWRKQSFFPRASVIGWAFLHSWTGSVSVSEKWRPLIDHFKTKTSCKDKKKVLEQKNSAINQPKLSANVCSWVQSCSQQIKERLTDTKTVAYRHPETYNEEESDVAYSFIPNLLRGYSNNHNPASPAPPFQWLNLQEVFWPLLLSIIIALKKCVQQYIHRTFQTDDSP